MEISGFRRTGCDVIGLRGGKFASFRYDEMVNF
jgi:hypothetical protein